MIYARSVVSSEEFERAGLYDPAGGDPSRLELLNWLTAAGFSVDELVEAAAENNLLGVASDRRVVEGEQLSDREAIAVSGLSAAHVEAFAMAFGFTHLRQGELGLTKTEAETLGAFHAIGTMFSEEEALGFVRVVGSAIGRISEAAVSLFLTDVESPHLESRGSEFELAKKSFEAVGLLDDFVPLLDTVLRRHITQATRRSRAASITDERRVMRYAVGFIDLVGFTPISRNMSAAELGAFIRDFEGRAHDAITAAGARLVKLIGDEIMFVTPHPDVACEVAQSLMVGFRTERAGEVLPRGGLAYGDVLIQGGDYYGEVVNLASRLADTAVPMELLVTGALNDAATTYDFEPAGRRQLKGFADPIVVHSMFFDWRP